jgi:hypothetical protein
MSNIDYNLVWNIAVVFISPFIYFAINNFLDSRKKLISHYGHIGVFKLHNGDNVFTHSVVIRNNSHKPITGIRLWHNVLPESVDVYPKNIEYSKTDKEIIIPKLVGKEEITFSYLYFPPITYDQINKSIKSDSGFVKHIETIIVPKVPKWLIFTIYFLMTIGLITTIYFFFQLLKTI